MTGRPGSTLTREPIMAPIRTWSGAPAGSLPPAVWNLALGWILLLPMLFLSANGSLLPRAEDISFAATGEAATSSVSHMAGVALVMLLFGVLIASRWSTVLAVCLRMRIMLALPLLAIVSTAWSVQPWKSMVSGFILLTFTVFAIYVSIRFDFQKRLELIMFVGGVALPLSIALALFVPSLGAGASGWRGVFGHKQNCGAVCMLWLITALHWKAPGIHRQIFRATYVLMCGILIVMSQSRTGWLLAVIALLLTAALRALQRLPKQEALLIFLLALPVIAGAAYGIHGYSASLASSVGKDPTLSERTIIWGAVWDAILQHPLLGYGFAAFWSGLYGASQNIVLISGWALAQAQNGFLDVWLQVGALGVVLVAIIAFQAMKNAARCFHAKGKEAPVRWCIVILVTTLLYNVGESSIALLHMVWFLFLLAYLSLEEIARSTPRL